MTSGVDIVWFVRRKATGAIQMENSGEQTFEFDHAYHRKRFTFRVAMPAIFFLLVIGGIWLNTRKFPFVVTLVMLAMMIRIVRKDLEKFRQHESASLRIVANALMVSNTATGYEAKIECDAIERFSISKNLLGEKGLNITMKTGEKHRLAGYSQLERAAEELAALGAPREDTP